MKQAFRLMLSLILALSAACSDKTRKVVEEAYPDGNPKVVKVYSEERGKKELLREITYYPGKSKQMEGEYRKDQRHGKWVYYYENGNIWSEGSFSDGQSDGLRITYYENGQTRYAGKYKKGVRTGRWKFFDEQGNLLKEIDYQDGSGQEKEEEPAP